MVVTKITPLPKPPYTLLKLKIGLFFTYIYYLVIISKNTQNRLLIVLVLLKIIYTRYYAHHTSSHVIFHCKKNFEVN